MLDIDTSMGDVSQLGHASSLHSGQRVRTGERWHGSPAQPTRLNYLRVSARRDSAFRRFRFSAVTWRGLGVRIGKRVFDDGCYLTERTLTAIGDDVMLNAGSKIQCHSQEDGTFKSDRTTIGAGCTIGVGAMIHYGVVMGEGSVLAPDSFLMKGEEIPPRAQWGGNPAREI